MLPTSNNEQAVLPTSNNERKSMRARLEGAAHLIEVGIRVGQARGHKPLWQVDAVLHARGAAQARGIRHAHTISHGHWHCSRQLQQAGSQAGGLPGGRSLSRERSNGLKSLIETIACAR